MKSFLGNFYRHLAVFSGHTEPVWTGFGFLTSALNVSTWADVTQTTTSKTTQRATASTTGRTFVADLIFCHSQRLDTNMILMIVIVSLTNGCCSWQSLILHHPIQSNRSARLLAKLSTTTAFEHPNGTKIIFYLKAWWRRAYDDDVENDDDQCYKTHLARPSQEMTKNLLSEIVTRYVLVGVTHLTYIHLKQNCQRFLWLQHIKRDITMLGFTTFVGRDPIHARVSCSKNSFITSFPLEIW